MRRREEREYRGRRTTNCYLGLGLCWPAHSHSSLAAPTGRQSKTPAPPPDGEEKPDPVKLAFARAAAYKKERGSPSPSPAPPPTSTPPPPPPPPSQPQAAAGDVGSKEAFKRALDHSNGNGTGARAGGGEAPLLGGSLDFGELMKSLE